jgi:hypothetical protein
MPRKPVQLETPAEAILRRYKAAIEQAATLFAIKNADYNGGVPLMSYFPFGLESHAQMIHVKSQRIVSLAKSGNVASHESVIDSAIDVINYSAFLIMSEDGENEQV